MLKSRWAVVRILNLEGGEGRGGEGHCSGQAGEGALFGSREEGSFPQPIFLSLFSSLPTTFFHSLDCSSTAHHQSTPFFRKSQLSTSLQHIPSSSPAFFHHTLLITSALFFSFACLAYSSSDHQLPATSIKSFQG